jgi:hypothetical protein
LQTRLNDPDRLLTPDVTPREAATLAALRAVRESQPEDTTGEPEELAGITPTTESAETSDAQTLEVLVMLPGGTPLRLEVELEAVMVSEGGEPEDAAASQLELTVDGVPLTIEAMKTDGVVTVDAQPDTPAAARQRYDQLHRRLGVDPATVSPSRRESHAQVCGKLLQRSARPNRVAPVPRARESSRRRRRSEQRARSGDGRDRPSEPPDQTTRRVDRASARSPRRARRARR